MGILGLNLAVRMSPSLSWTQRCLFACLALPGSRFSVTLVLQAESSWELFRFTALDTPQG